MEYQATAVPIHTEAEFDAAVAAGARIEFTACANGYDLPPHGSGPPTGWVPTDYYLVEGETLLGPRQRLRAFYPATRNED